MAEATPSRHEDCQTNFEHPRDHFLRASNGVPMDKGVIEGIVAGSPRGCIVTCNHAVCSRPGHAVKLPDYQLPLETSARDPADRENRGPRSQAGWALWSRDLEAATSEAGGQFDGMPGPGAGGAITGTMF
jgi:hypothetical protein